jgi:hypothetical protein
MRRRGGRLPGPLHTFTWQLNPGGHSNNGGVQSRAVNGEGVSGFLLSGPRGHVRGWVIGPPGTRVLPGDPLRVEATGASVELVVVMTIGRSEPPPAVLDDDGLTIGSGAHAPRVTWHDGLALGSASR